MKVVIIDYKMGNLLSVLNAFRLIGCDAEISNKPRDIESSSHIILPGVGSFSEGIGNLLKLGLAEALYNEVVLGKKPFLGICLGMQLLLSESQEQGMHKGLGWIPGRVVRLKKNADFVRIPHIGWNEVISKKGAVLFSNLDAEPIFYFVHSYHCVCKSEDVVSAYCHYGSDLVASIQKDNIFATQFHPEKSQIAGLNLLRNFMGISSN